MARHLSQDVVEVLIEGVRVLNRCFREIDSCVRHAAHVINDVIGILGDARRVGDQ